MKPLAPLLLRGDCLVELARIPSDSIDAVVTDPPYGLAFMGHGWDKYTPLDFERWVESWARECLRILKPGGHLLAFGGTRTWHRLAAGVEDAGLELRDSIAWLYGSGFPKSMDVSKAIASKTGRPEDIRRMAMGDDYTPSGRGRVNYDNGAGSKMNGETRVAPATPDALAWQGWGTALKPAFEPVVVARKPLDGTVAANVLKHGTGAMNIDAGRVGTRDALTGSGQPPLSHGGMNSRPFHAEHVAEATVPHAAGRWPANVILDESQAAALDEQSGTLTSGLMKARTNREPRKGGTIYGADQRNIVAGDTYADTGGASRFFYCAKASKSERPVVDGVAHSTVKPLALMRYLVKLVTPPGGVVVDPFAGSGTTLEAAYLEGFECIGVELTPEYWPLIAARIARVT